MSRTVESPYSFITLERACRSLGLTAGVDADDEKAADAMNWSIGEMDGYVSRGLAARSYREPFSLSGTISGAVTFTVASGASAVHALDDVTQPAGTTLVQDGTRVASVTGDTIITLSSASTSGAATLQFGSAPLIVYGNGRSDIGCPERPLNALYAARIIGVDGGEESVAVTDMDFDPDIGNIRRLDGGVWTKGSRIELDVMAGFLQPTAAQVGHRSDWNALARVQLRMVQIFFGDDSKARGRSTESRAGQSSSGFESYEMPADIKATLDGYMRMW